MRKRQTSIGFRIALVLTLFISFNFAVFSAGKAEKTDAPIRMRLAHNVHESHPNHIGSVRFKELVESRTNGRIMIEIFANNSLGDPIAYTEQIHLGALDMGLSTSGQLQLWVREHAAVMIPFLFESYKHAHAALDGEAGRLLAELAEVENFVILANWEWGFRQLSNNKFPVERPADVGRLRMRVPDEIQLKAMYETLGASTHVISFAELYLALAQNVVDGQCNPLATIYYQSLYEVQPYVTLLNHIYNTQMLVVSRKVYESMSADYQQIVRQAAIEAGQLVRELTEVEEKKILDALRKAGVKVNQPNLAPFRDAMGPAVKRIAEYTGQEFTDRFIDLVDSAR